MTSNHSIPEPDPSDAVSDDVPGEAATAPRGGRRLFWWAIAIAVVVLLVDQGTKWWAESALGNGERIPVIGDVIRFVLLYNPGAAFSIGAGATWVFTILAGLAMVGIAAYAWRVRSAPWAITLGMLLGGATTHFGDRLLRAPGFGRGHVVDFIDYAGFFVGNVADIVLFAGAVMIVVLSSMDVRTTEDTDADTDVNVDVDVDTGTDAGTDTNADVVTGTDTKASPAL
ncbi:signal peptidase II [Streptomyces sp. A5-4]|uniref:signal peptidase II n=1 Tax=Streptomyces sp. A5-4 TaxID=3384771 RepID=UPI003DA84D23